jgi:excinuclease ABC subunit C
MLPDALTQKLDALPAAPGVYIFKDKKNAIVYIGKAKSLRSRVRSYFQADPADTRFFIPILQRTVGDLDTIVTATEKEAAILENTLIKEHHPRYNVKLRDGKEFLCLRLAPKDSWPRLQVVRHPLPDGARYFGPYPSATSARRTLHLVNKYFQLRTCRDSDLVSRKRPCLQHQIKRCPAPCAFEVDRAFYAEQVDAVALFLSGRHDDLSRELQTRMAASSRAMRFELAAVYRDQLRAIEKVRESQHVVSVESTDRDVVAIYREGDLVELALLSVRAGKLADVATFSLKKAEIPNEEILSAFLAQHYVETDGAKSEVVFPIPNEILLPEEPEGLDGIAEWLGEYAGHKVSLAVPQRGHKFELLTLAKENAEHAFSEKRRASDDLDERLHDLQNRLRLPVLPRRIECCDISHLGGSDTVGAIVALTDGEPDKKRYRTFRVRGEAHGGKGDVNDDYGAMYEVLARRFRRGRPESPPDLAESTVHDADADDEVAQGWELPDLFVVDGGRGQLAVAMTAARDLGLHDLPIVALAKERETATGETMVDRVYLPGQKNPVLLKSHTASLFFLARARDEAHRFSNVAREKIGKKKRFRSLLDDVKGVGKKTQKALLKHFGSLDAVRTADDEALRAVKGVSTRHVRALRAAFGPRPSQALENPPTEGVATNGSVGAEPLFCPPAGG